MLSFIKLLGEIEGTHTAMRLIHVFVDNASYHKAGIGHRQGHDGDELETAMDFDRERPRAKSPAHQKQSGNREAAVRVDDGERRSNGSPSSRVSPMQTEEVEEAQVALITAEAQASSSFRRDERSDRNGSRGLNRCGHGRIFAWASHPVAIAMGIGASRLGRAFARPQTRSQDLPLCHRVEAMQMDLKS